MLKRFFLKQTVIYNIFRIFCKKLHMQCVQVLMGKQEHISNKFRKQAIGIPSVKQVSHTNYSIQVHINIIVVEIFGGWHFLKSC